MFKTPVIQAPIIRLRPPPTICRPRPPPQTQDCAAARDLQTEQKQRVAEKETIERDRTKAAQTTAAAAAATTAAALPNGVQPDGSKITRAANRLDTVTDKTGRTKTFGYNQNGELDSVRMSGGQLGGVAFERSADKAVWQVRPPHRETIQILKNGTRAEPSPPTSAAISRIKREKGDR